MGRKPKSSLRRGVLRTESTFSVGGVVRSWKAMPDEEFSLLFKASFASGRGASETDALGGIFASSVSVVFSGESAAVAAVALIQQTRLMPAADLRFPKLKRISLSDSTSILRF